MSCFVVTGSAGFIGSHLADALMSAGHEVIGIDCFTTYYSDELKRENAREQDIVAADVTTAPLDDYFRGVDGVFHLAARPGVRGSWGDAVESYLRHNLLASSRVFEAAARRDVPVVLASSSSVYGDSDLYPTPETAPLEPRSPYGVTKLAAERLAAAAAKAFGLHVVTLRFFTVYGPRQRPDMAFARMFRAAASGEPFQLHGDGSQSRDVTYVADAVDAARLAMARGQSGAVYNVGGGTEVTLNDVATMCEAITQRPLSIARSAQAHEDVFRTVADTSRIRTELGWRPAVALDDGLRAQWDWTIRDDRSAAGETAIRAQGNGGRRLQPSPERR